MSNEWIQVGAQVALYQYSHPPRVSFTKVERLTATQIVLASGDRFRRDTLREVGDSKRSAWSGHTTIMDPTSGQVRKAHAGQLMKGLFGWFDRIERDADRNGTKPAAILDLIEAQVAKYRKAILNVTDVEGEE